MLVLPYTGSFNWCSIIVSERHLVEFGECIHPIDLLKISCSGGSRLFSTLVALSMLLVDVQQVWQLCFLLVRYQEELHYNSL